VEDEIPVNEVDSICLARTGRDELLDVEIEALCIVDGAEGLCMKICDGVEWTDRLLADPEALERATCKAAHALAVWTSEGTQLGYPVANIVLDPLQLLL
jgi:hypothetical protein